MFLLANNATKIVQYDAQPHDTLGASFLVSARTIPYELDRLRTHSTVFIHRSGCENRLSTHANLHGKAKPATFHLPASQGSQFGTCHRVQAKCPHSQVIQAAAGHVAAELLSLVLLQHMFHGNLCSVARNKVKHLDKQAITLSSEMARDGGKPYCQRQQPCWFLCYLCPRVPR